MNKTPSPIEVSPQFATSSKTAFTDLNLIEPLQRAVKESGYSEPTQIQIQAIPYLLQGKDLLGCAQTGTGKTAAFALPILNQLVQFNHRAQPKSARVLVLTPTRELAIQIFESFQTYGKHLRLHHAVVFGGVGQSPQVRSVARGVDVLVATPGRLLDLINQRHLTLSNLEVFVLDEADRMLDMGFIHDIRRIIKLLPLKRQNLFFSATMPPEIQKLADSMLTNPVKVAVAGMHRRRPSRGDHEQLPPAPRNTPRSTPSTKSLPTPRRRTRASRVEAPLQVDRVLACPMERHGFAARRHVCDENSALGLCLEQFNALLAGLLAGLVIFRLVQWHGAGNTKWGEVFEQVCKQFDVAEEYRPKDHLVSRGDEGPHKVLLIVQRHGLLAQRIHRRDVPPVHSEQARDRRVLRLSALSQVSAAWSI